MAGHGLPMGSPGMTTIEIPYALRDRLRNGKAHEHQAYHELIRAALDHWDNHGGWDLADRRPRPLQWV